ncbi:YqaJ viral recombinase family nuclease [Burkholderia cenocepacia]|uniref:YqaJ viral recombinase family nuclease n=1 Tax=Burkholderia cenocepacia TaxID=95486 RepID=UPI002B25310C|nr:YqaJ viral recombinase family protein [Burkholderia cenocepacia]MEB2499557.1 YqaJ viral recombinase family protein [Burkholderia cenocepacia]MEB2557232.1 YqaJ viral recombinase family protein [Burkholderia cenocepacia]
MNTREQWLAERRTGIGGSDAAAALGQSRHRSAYELWAEKTGQLAGEDVDSERMQFGRVMESVIANMYTAQQQVRVRRRNTSIVHPRYPFMRANVDRIVEGRRVGLECKNVDAMAYRFGEWGDPGSDEVPVEYLLQCAHYMCVLDYDEWHLAACVGGNRLATYVIHRDRELEQILIEGEATFWRHVESNDPPPFDFGHAQAIPLLRRLYPNTNGETVALDAEIAHWHAVKVEAEEQVKLYQGVIDASKAHILKAMGEAAIGRLPGVGEYRRKTVRRAGYTVEPCDYVDFRFARSKEPNHV